MTNQEVNIIGEITWLLVYAQVCRKDGAELVISRELKNRIEDLRSEIWELCLYHKSTDTPREAVMASGDLPVVRSSQVPVFNMDNNLTIADILSVAVGEAEAKLQKILKEGMVKYKAIEEKIKQVGKDLEIQTDALQVSCGLQEDIDTANKILSRLFEVTININVAIDKKKKLVEYNYGCMHSHGTKKVPFTPEIVMLVDLLASEQEALDQARADVAETRKRLANIPALERRYRGKLVASQLQKSDEGKSVMAIITANMEEELRNI